MFARKKNLHVNVYVIVDPDSEVTVWCLQTCRSKTVFVHLILLVDKKMFIFALFYSAI